MNDSGARFSTLQWAIHSGRKPSILGPRLTGLSLGGQVVAYLARRVTGCGPREHSGVTFKCPRSAFGLNRSRGSLRAEMVG